MNNVDMLRKKMVFRMFDRRINYPSMHDHIRMESQNENMGRFQ